MTFDINSNYHFQINSNKNQTKVIRGGETTYDRELKNTTPKLINPKQSYKKNTMIHQLKAKLKEIIQNWERERERERVANS